MKCPICDLKSDLDFLFDKSNTERGIEYWYLFCHRTYHVVNSKILSGALEQTAKLVEGRLVKSLDYLKDLSEEQIRKLIEENFYYKKIENPKLKQLIMNHWLRRASKL